MSQRTVATASTGAITDGSQVAFSLQAKDFKYGKPIVSVSGLTAAETVSFWFWTDGTWEELADSTGTQIAFTATDAVSTFDGPGTYGFTKIVSAGAITLNVDDGR